MALAVDTATNGNNTGGTSMSWSHTSSGSNRVGIVLAVFNAGVTSPSATWGGVSMTLLSLDPAASGFIATFGIIAPATGAQTIALSWTGFAFSEGQSISFTGADQTAPFGTTVYTKVTSGTSISNSVTTTTANSMIVIGSNANQLYSVINATGTNNTMQSSSKNNGQIWGSVSNQTTTSAGSYTAGHAGATFSTTWYMHATEIKPVSSGTIFTQGVSGSLSFSGSFAKLTNHRMNASQSFTGNYLKSISHKIIAGLSFTGALNRATKYIRSITAALSFVGGVTKNRAKVFTAQLSFASTTYPTSVLQDNPISYWRLGESSGTVARDSVGTNDGTYSAGYTQGQTSIINDPSDAAVLLDGITGYVPIGNPAPLQLSQYTYEAWIKTSAPGASYRGVLTKVNAVGMFVYNGKLAAYSYGAPAGLKDSGVSVSDGQPHLLNMVVDQGVTNGTKLYVDGVLVLTTTTAVLNQGSGISIGGGDSGTSQRYQGVVDEVAIYGSLLGPSQIQNHYYDGIGQGYFIKKTNHVLTGSLSFVGLLSRALSKNMVAALSFVGTLKKALPRIFTASLSFTGKIIKNTGHRLAGNLSFTGFLTKGAIFFRSFSGGLSFIGTLKKMGVKRLTAALSFVGLFKKARRVVLAANLSFTGTFRKFSKKSLTANLSFLGTISSFIKPHFVNLKVIISSFTNKATENSGTNLGNVNSGDTISTIESDSNERTLG